MFPRLSGGLRRQQHEGLGGRISQSADFARLHQALCDGRLRLGYCLCANPPLLERMAGLGQPWGVSVPAQIAGVAALSDTDYLRRTRELIAQERGYLKQQLGKLPVRVIGSQANYIFFHAPEGFRAGEIHLRRTRAGRHFDSQLRQLLRNAQGLLPPCRALPMQTIRSWWRQWSAFLFRLSSRPRRRRSP